MNASESPHVPNSITDGGVMRILLADDINALTESDKPLAAGETGFETHSVGNDLESEGSRNCPRCELVVNREATVCPHCSCYFGVVPDFMRSIS